MTAQANRTNLILRNDTILGVCEALGQDFGINANWFRVAFCLPVFWNPVAVIAAYFGVGAVVAVTRLAFPNRYVDVVEGSKPATVEAPAAPAEEREPELVAA